MFERDSDQELFQDTTHRFLQAESNSTIVRSLERSANGFERQYWRRGAELGWTSLVVPDRDGGGTVSGSGVADLVLVAYEFGLHAAPGPLGPCNLVAAAIGRFGTERQRREILPSILSGESTAAWALAESPPHQSLGEVGLVAGRDGDGLVLNGVKVPVEAAGVAEHLLVTVRDGTGLTQAVVPRDAPGLDVDELHGLDLTRRYARVTFDDVRVPIESIVGRAGHADDDVAWLTDLGVVIQLAETVGAMQWAFDTTLEWAFNRYSFGRPLASYQEIKHRFADLKMWLEASYAITRAAADAVENESPDRTEIVSAGKFYVGRQSGELLHDCVQLHGGIGVTFDHDLHLFLRRVTANMATFGTPNEHAARITRALESEVPEPRREDRHGNS